MSTTTQRQQKRVISQLTTSKPGKATRYGENAEKKNKLTGSRATVVPRMFPDINQRCKEIREHLKLTQAELAERIGITVSMVKSVENMVVSPNFYYVISLSKISHKTTDYILKGE